MTLENQSFLCFRCGRIIDELRLVKHLVYDRNGLWRVRREWLCLDCFLRLYPPDVTLTVRESGGVAVGSVPNDAGGGDISTHTHAHTLSLINEGAEE